MKILQLPQGHYGDLTGMSMLNAVAMFTVDSLAFLAKHPQCQPYHHPLWRELEAKDSETAPWGYEWWLVNEDGKLQRHSAYYDSSG